jgi:hypothetical protein
MSGHLFIVQGDLTRLACDAWLLPTGRSLLIRNHWLRDAPPTLLRLVTKSADSDINVPATYVTWRFRGLLQSPAGWTERRDRTFDLVTISRLA